MPSGITEHPSEGRRRGIYRRRETYAEKLDRNWSEILQELRVLQTGLQLIGGFLLTLPFQARFTVLDAYATSLYAFLVVTAGVALTVVLMPLGVHRRLFRRQVKNRLVASGAWAAKVGLGLAAVLIVGTSALIFDVAVGRWQAWAVGAALALLCTIMFLGVPAAVAHKPSHELPAEPETTPGDTDGESP